MKSQLKYWCIGVLLGCGPITPIAAQVVATPGSVRPVAPSVSIRTQATALRRSADSMRTLGTQKLPDGLTKSQVKDAKQYQAWLLASAKRLDRQAVEGDKLAKASAESGSNEESMSFNLQYLELQSQMQHENRSYTAISNIMKAKHDAAKNAINNVR
jgi:hypothetical protein